MNIRNRIDKLEMNINGALCNCVENKGAIECRSFIDGDAGAVLGQSIPDNSGRCGKTINKITFCLVDGDETE